MLPPTNWNVAPRNDHGDKPRVMALVGPTASGKTDFGIALAEHFDAEIINADSRQVFRRLDIGSAKPTAAQRARVRHHLIDVVDPSDAFDCAQFRQLALAAIADIGSRGKRVMVVGGSGLYIKTLLHGMFEGPARDANLRDTLQRLEGRAPGSLHRRLADIDPASAERVHANDHMRLMRAIEVFQLTGKAMSAWQDEHRFRQSEVQSLVVALDLPRTRLYQRIERRCDEMIAAGLETEVRDLLANGLDPEGTAMQAPGYREMAGHVGGRLSLVAARSQMVQATRRLAKRQITWFRGDPTTRWEAPDFDRLAQMMRSFWGRD